jgi:hypothetical protein
LYARETGNAPLDLGDVHIYGETSIPSDTTSMDRDITQYYAVSISSFEYKPYFSFVDIPFPKPEFIPRTAAIQFKGGNHYFGDFRGTYHANNILKLTSKFSYKELKDKWQTTRFMFGWQPEVLNSDFDISFKQNVYQFDDAKTEIAGFSFNLQNISTLFSNENATEIDCTLGINKLSQNNGTSNTENDFYFKSFISQKTQFALVNFLGNYLRNSFCGELSISSDWQPYVESAGFWLGASNKSQIYPSLILNKRFDLLPEFYLSIINQPKLFTRSQLDLLDLDNYLDINPDKEHTIRPLDLKITTGINWIADLAIYYNPIIDINHAEFLPQAGESIHKIEYDNIALQKMGVTVSLKSGRLLLKENFEYIALADYIYKDQFIPYLAELENITSVEYNLELIKIQLSVHYIGECEDEMRNTIDDVLLLNLYSSYRFRESIQILFEIENLLDTKYKQFSNTPHERLQFNFGVRIAF